MQRKLSGHGTTHHTNCIAVQFESHAEPEPMRQQSVSKRLRSLKQLPTTSLPHISREKRTGPTCFYDRAMDLVGGWTPNRDDLCYIIMKYFSLNPSEFPGWTGWNTLRHHGQILVKSNVTYLPVIEASSTEMDTIYEIIRRAIILAEQLDLSAIVMVHDLAIYAKVQEARWLSKEIAAKTVIRLGEFHLTMSFLGILGKRYRDAGLLDVMIVSELVASGSVNSVMNGHHYNRAIRTHKIMYEALSRMRFSAFLETLDLEKVERIRRYSMRLDDAFPSRLFDQLFNESALNDKSQVSHIMSSSMTHQRPVPHSVYGHLTF